MRTYFKKIKILSILILLLVILESCSGCGNRRRANRDRQQDRVERREYRRSRERDRTHDREGDDVANSFGGKYSEEYLESIAEGDDYDAMLDCMFARVDEMRKLKNEYFRGHMSDKEAKAKYEEIDKRYHSVESALQKADSGGELNFKQHKRQLKLLSEYIKEIDRIGKRLGQELRSL